MHTLLLKLRLVVALLWCCASASAQISCQTPAVVLPVRNVTLANAVVVVRGIPLSAGTPPQNLAFGADPNGANNTILVSSDTHCLEFQSAGQCEESEGGSFDNTTSSTWEAASSIVGAGGASTNGDEDDTGTSDSYGTDTLWLTEQTPVEYFPFDVTSNSRDGYNVLGLGRNSTILNTLLQGGLIESRIWSFFSGLSGADQASWMDGSLILGGYDEAKTNGSNYTMPITHAADCNLYVNVTSIELNFPNGTDSDIVSPTTYGLLMCIAPNTPFLTLPDEMVQNFYAQAGGTPSTQENIFPTDDVYDGDLTITLDTGLQIVISNSELVVPEYNLTSSGDLTSVPGFRSILLSTTEVTHSTIPLLGLPFLTAAYLSVDYDADTFTLWQATPTTEQKIVAVGTDDSSCTVAVSTTSPSAAVLGSHSKPSSSPALSHSVTHTISAGSVAGITVGSLALAGLAAAAALFFRRRRLRRGQQHSFIPPLEFNRKNRRNGGSASYMPANAPSGSNHEYQAGQLSDDDDGRLTPTSSMPWAGHDIYAAMRPGGAAATEAYAAVSPLSSSEDPRRRRGDLGSGGSSSGGGALYLAADAEPPSIGSGGSRPRSSRIRSMLGLGLGGGPGDRRSSSRPVSRIVSALVGGGGRGSYTETKSEAATADAEIIATEKGNEKAAGTGVRVVSELDGTSVANQVYELAGAAHESSSELA